MSSKWVALQWFRLETLVAVTSLAPESHRALSVPGWNRPKNRLSDKELKATGGLGLKKGTEREIFFLPSAGKMTNIQS